MQQMASRPFASINVALETDEEPPDLIGGSIKVRVHACRVVLPVINLQRCMFCTVDTSSNGNQLVMGNL